MSVTLETSQLPTDWLKKAQFRAHRHMLVTLKTSQLVIGRL